MHQESRATRIPEPEPIVAEESVKPSKLARIKSAAITTSIFVIPTAVTVAGAIVGYKTSSMNFETAKLNLEAAKLAKAAANAAQKS